MSELTASDKVYAEYQPLISGSEGPRVTRYANGSGVNLEVLSGYRKCQVNFVMPPRGTCNVRCEARRGAKADSHRINIYRNDLRIMSAGIGTTYLAFSLDNVPFEAGDNITVACSAWSGEAFLKMVQILAEEANV